MLALAGVQASLLWENSRPAFRRRPRSRPHSPVSAILLPQRQGVGRGRAGWDASGAPLLGAPVLRCRCFVMAKGSQTPAVRYGRARAAYFSWIGRATKGNPTSALREPRQMCGR